MSIVNYYGRGNMQVSARLHNWTENINIRSSHIHICVQALACNNGGIAMKKKNSREKIILAAFEVFSKKGYKATTTKELAKKAGVNEVTLFRIFKNKENLYREMLNYYANIDFISTQIHLEVTGDAHTDLRNFLKAVIQPIPMRNKIIKLIMMDAHSNPIVKKKLNEFPRALYYFFAEYLKTVLPRKYTRDVDIDIASLILLSYLLRYSILDSMIGKDPFNADDEKNIEKFLDIFLYGILNQGADKGDD